MILLNEWLTLKFGILFFARDSAKNGQIHVQRTTAVIGLSLTTLACRYEMHVTVCVEQVVLCTI
jgi:hypothetical protein